MIESIINIKNYKNGNSLDENGYYYSLLYLYAIQYNMHNVFKKFHLIISFSIFRAMVLNIPIINYIIYNII